MTKVSADVLVEHLCSAQPADKSRLDHIKDRVDWYEQLNELLKHHDMEAIMFTSRSDSLLGLAMDDVVGDNEDGVALWALRLVGYCLHVEKITSSMSEAVLNKVLSSLANTILTTKSKAVCNLSCWCLALQAVPPARLSPFVPRLAEVLAQTLETNRFSSTAIEREAIMAIKSLWYRSPKAMCSTGDMWALELTKRAISDHELVREKALQCLQIVAGDLTLSAECRGKLIDQVMGETLPRWNAMLANVEEAGVDVMNGWGPIVSLLGSCLYRSRPGHAGPLISSLLQMPTSCLGSTSEAVRIAALRNWCFLLENFAHAGTITKKKRIPLILAPITNCLRSDAMSAVRHAAVCTWTFLLNLLSPDTPDLNGDFILPVATLLWDHEKDSSIRLAFADFMTRWCACKESDDSTNAIPIPKCNEYLVPRYPLFYSPATMNTKTYDIALSILEESLDNIKSSTPDSTSVGNGSQIYRSKSSTMWVSMFQAVIRNVQDIENGGDRVSALLHHFVDMVSFRSDEPDKNADVAVMSTFKACLEQVFISWGGILRREMFLSTAGVPSVFDKLVEVFASLNLPDGETASETSQSDRAPAEQCSSVTEVASSLWRSLVVLQRKGLDTLKSHHDMLDIILGEKCMLSAQYKLLCWKICAHELYSYIDKSNEVFEGPESDMEMHTIRVALKAPVALMYTSEGSVTSDMAADLSQTWGKLFQIVYQKVSLYAEQPNICIEKVIPRKLQYRNDCNVSDAAWEFMIAICTKVSETLVFKEKQVILRNKELEYRGPLSLSRFIGVIGAAMRSHKATSHLASMANVLSEVGQKLFKFAEIEHLLEHAGTFVRECSDYMGSLEEESQALSRAVDHAQMSWLTCIRDGCVGHGDSDLLARSSDLFIFGFASPNSTLKNLALAAWKSVFGCEGVMSLTYPERLIPVLEKARVTVPDIPLPDWKPISQDGVSSGSPSRDGVMDMDVEPKAQAKGTPASDKKRKHSLVDGTVAATKWRIAGSPKASPATTKASRSFSPASKKRLIIGDDEDPVDRKKDFVKIASSKEPRELSEHRKESLRHDTTVTFYNGIDDASTNVTTVVTAVTDDADEPRDSAITPKVLKLNGGRGRKQIDANEGRMVSPAPKPSEEIDGSSKEPSTPTTTEQSAPATPIVGILKRPSPIVETPAREDTSPAKRKVKFQLAVVAHEDHSPKTTPTKPVFPLLQESTTPLSSLSMQLGRRLTQHLASLSVTTVGELATMSLNDVRALPVDCALKTVTRVLTEFYQAEKSINRSSRASSGSSPRKQLNSFVTAAKKGEPAQMTAGTVITMLRGLAGMPNLDMFSNDQLIEVQKHLATVSATVAEALTPSTSEPLNEDA